MGKEVVTTNLHSLARSCSTSMRISKLKAIDLTHIILPKSDSRMTMLGQHIYASHHGFVLLLIYNAPISRVVLSSSFLPPYLLQKCIFTLCMLVPVPGLLNSIIPLRLLQINTFNNSHQSQRDRNTKPQALQSPMQAKCSAE